MPVLAVALSGAAVLAGVGAQTAAAAGPQLVGEWRFDEAGQTALDGGPFGLDGRLGATTEVDAADPVRIAGARGGALSFTGESYVRLPDAAELDLQELSAEAVVRSAASPGRYRYIASRGGDRCFAGSYGLYTGASGGIAIYVFDGSRYVVSAAAPPADVWDGRWHHVAGTFDGHALRLFLDGRPVGEPAAFSARIDYATTSTATYLGQYAGACDLAFHGDLDLVRIWSGALSPTAIVAAARTESEAGGGAPVLGTPLPGATPPTTLSGRSGKSSGTRPAAGAGSPLRACVVRVSRKRIQARQRAVVRVGVRLRGRPLRATRVIARWSRKGGVLSAARTGARGKVRLVIRARRAGKLRVSAARKKPSCASAYIKVTRFR